VQEEQWETLREGSEDDAERRGRHAEEETVPIFVSQQIEPGKSTSGRDQVEAEVTVKLKKSLEHRRHLLGGMGTGMKGQEPTKRIRAKFQ
jgi:hypothetical protein